MHIDLSNKDIILGDFFSALEEILDLFNTRLPFALLACLNCSFESILALL